jgi:hypothetical protein
MKLVFLVFGVIGTTFASDVSESFMLDGIVPVVLTTSPSEMALVSRKAHLKLDFEQKINYSSSAKR